MLDLILIYAIVTVIAIRRGYGSSMFGISGIALYLALLFPLAKFLPDVSVWVVLVIAAPVSIVCLVGVLFALPRQILDAETTGKLLRVYSWVSFGLATAGIALVAVCLLVWPAFAKVFNDFHMDLPGLTRMLMMVPFWLAVALVAGWWISLVAKEFTAWPRWVTILLNGLSLLAATGILDLFLVALWLPFVEMISGRSR